ncbi:MAG: DUF3179 domain-containing (seleno)protein [Actinomycetota bacterium]
MWTHFDGLAVVGVLTGYWLEPIPTPLLAWADFAASYPDAQVLDRDATGHNRPYGANPYAGYDDPQAFPFLFRGTVEERAAAMQRVVGVARSGGLEWEGGGGPVQRRPDRLHLRRLRPGGGGRVGGAGPHPGPSPRHLLVRVGHLPARLRAARRLIA